MNENAKAWVAALRSGEWIQVQNALRAVGVEGGVVVTHSYCCLGVANEISGTGGWVDVGHFQDADQLKQQTAMKADPDGCERCGEYGDQCHCVFVSEEFASPMTQAWLGLSSEDGDLTLDGQKTSLAKLNDEGKTFAEIADIIEAHQDQLFVKGNYILDSLGKIR